MIFILTMLERTDVWSFGVLMWEVFSFGKVPYADHLNRNVAEHIKKGLRLEITESCPQDVYAIMQQCWATNPTQRPRFADIVLMLREKEDAYKTLLHGARDIGEALNKDLTAAIRSMSISARVRPTRARANPSDPAQQPRPTQYENPSTETELIASLNPTEHGASKLVNQPQPSATVSPTPVYEGDVRSAGPNGRIALELANASSEPSSNIDAENQDTREEHVDDEEDDEKDKTRPRQSEGFALSGILVPDINQPEPAEAQSLGDDDDDDDDDGDGVAAVDELVRESSDDVADEKQLAEYERRWSNALEARRARK